MRYRTIGYDSDKIDFVALIEELFGVERLDELNETHDELFKVGDDSKTSFHKKFYDKYREGWPEMERLYEILIRDVIQYRIPSPFLYQKFPTFRVHLQGNLAVGAFHNDAEFGHPPGEVNFIVPLTDSDGTASVWVESEPRKGDFEPMRMRVGCLIQFDGNRLTHGNWVNATGRTRVSMDFRILPSHMYKEESVTESLTRKTKLKEGDYYKRFVK